MRSYVEVLSPRAHLLLAVSGLLARVPLAVVGFAALLVVRRTTGEFALAGTVSAVVVATGALVGPALGRWADRAGQPVALRAAAAVGVVGAALFVVVTGLGAPPPVVLVAAAVVGAGVAPVGSFTRTRWARRYPRRDGSADPRLATAFALEGVFDELVWVAGPALASLVAAAADPRLALLLACGAGAAGCLALSAQSHGQGSDAPGGHRRRTLPVTRPDVLGVLAAGVAVGAVFGLADLSAVALTTERGVPQLAGSVLGAGALGAVVGGLVVGVLPPVADSRRGAVAAAALFGVGYASLATVPGVAGVLVLSFVAGATYAPLGVAVNRLVEEAAPAHRLSESLAWVSTAVTAGTALGTVVGGFVVDAAGARGGYLLVAPLAVLPVLCTLVGTRLVRRREPTGRIGG
ncbi:MFS transporter [Kineococcus sp. NPDC059986]|uniref:MFS transporter n=1 Tax=Kineococcus sp. NPDC059986 TaxID=3155538 RepID=UPI00344EAF12